MNLTLPELKVRLSSKYDEVSLLEMLGVSSEELVEAFENKILEKLDELLKGLEEDGDFEPQEWHDEDPQN